MLACRGGSFNEGGVLLAVKGWKEDGWDKKIANAIGDDSKKLVMAKHFIIYNQEPL